MALSPLFERNPGLEAWYRPTDRAKLSIDSCMTVAYEQALQFHKDLFKDEKANTWLSGTTTISGVTNILTEAQKKYEVNKASRSKFRVTATSWWQAASSKLMHYERVIDTVVSSNPEYAAIVWGAMKFLFAATINHQELSAKIAQAFAEIGGVLPEMDFIASKLYPTEMIRLTLAHVYAQILEFCIRATRWYNDVRRSYLKKVFRSISKTWPLEFQDIRLNIDTHCRRLREQSAIAHQVETRDMHAKLIDIHGLLDISTSLQRGFGREATTLHPNPSLTKSLPFLKERVLPYLSGNSFSPNQAIELGSAMRERRRARYGTIPHKMWTNPQLQDWISNPASSMVLVKASLRRSESLRDFGLDMIQLLKSSQLTVIWYLGSLSGPTSKAISAVDLIRSFIDQIIQQHKDTSTGWRLNETDFHTCNSKDSWMSLLLAVLKEIPRIAIVVEAQEGLSSILQIMYRIWKYFTDAKITSVIKILVMIQTVHDGSIPAVPEMSHVSQLTFESGTGMRVSPALLKASRRRYGARHFLQGSKPGDLKPFVLRFVSLGCTEG